MTFTESTKGVDARREKESAPNDEEHRSVFASNRTTVWVGQIYEAKQSTAHSRSSRVV